jgi:hypothetical protein
MSEESVVDSLAPPTVLAVRVAKGEGPRPGTAPSYGGDDGATRSDGSRAGSAGGRPSTGSAPGGKRRGGGGAVGGRKGAGGGLRGSKVTVPSAARGNALLEFRFWFEVRRIVVLRRRCGDGGARRFEGRTFLRTVSLTRHFDESTD